MCALALLAPATAAAAPDLAQRGAYLARAAGCVACHTAPASDGPLLAGGVRLATPFGVFYSPNITPDPTTGIGAWSDADLARALRHGVAPDGRRYYPVFPYTAYAGMRGEDIAALAAYLRTVPAVSRRPPAHQLPWYLRWRALNRLWQWLFHEPAAAVPANNRGAYLVDTLAHCGECHTPRNRFGALDRDRYLAGNPAGPDGEPVPNITPHRGSGIGRWGRNALRDYLRSGLTPGGDFAGGAMVEVIDAGLSHLHETDLDAIVDYLRSVPAVDNRIGGGNND